MVTSFFLLRITPDNFYTTFTYIYHRNMIIYLCSFGLPEPNIGIELRSAKSMFTATSVKNITSMIKQKTFRNVMSMGLVGTLHGIWVVNLQKLTHHSKVY